MNGLSKILVKLNISNENGKKKLEKYAYGNHIVWCKANKYKEFNK